MAVAMMAWSAQEVGGENARLAGRTAGRAVSGLSPGAGLATGASSFTSRNCAPCRLMRCRSVWSSFVGGATLRAVCLVTEEESAALQ